MADLHGKRLSTYLNDHLAAATGGSELAKRTAASNEGSAYGAFLAGLAQEVEEDRQALLDVMDRLGVEKNQVKVSLGWLAEKAGRLKLNDQLTGYSPLSRLIELEGLLLGITGKQALWVSLQEVAADRLGGIDLVALAERAQRQREGVEDLRRQALREALAG
jgi:hypothetical protein